MESTSMRADTTGNRRALSLPSFRRLNGEGGLRRRRRRRSAAASAAASKEAAAAARKAAAWQWHSRGVAEKVVAAMPSPAAGDGSRPVPSGLKSCTRFKAEAIANAQAKNPIPKPPLTPLYDKADLSGLKYHISSFLQQQDSTQSDARKLTTIKAQCIPADQSIARSPCRPPTTEKHVSVSRSTAAIPRNLSLSSVFSAPVSALHSLYRKILSRRSQASRRKPSSAEPTSLEHESETGHIKYHYHRYIHHHHHHYHYGTAISDSPDTDNTPRFRRFSESAYTRGCSPSSVYGSSDEIDSEDEETESSDGPDSALSALHRRYSDSSFSEKHKFAEVVRDIVVTKLDTKIAMENAEKEEPRLPSRHSSERYSKEALEGVLHDGLRRKREDGKGRRRHSMESLREGECMRYDIGSRQLP